LQFCFTQFVTQFSRTDAMSNRHDSALSGTLLHCILCSRLMPGLFAGCLLAASVLHANAAVRDDFESAEVSWRPGDADLSYHLDIHQRINTDPHAGHGSELLQISAGAGTYVYFTHELGTARIVAELAPSVWVKANRTGIQLLARVILPHTIDPRTGQPTATLIQGSSYSAVGAWQQLQIGDTPQLLSRQVRALRAQLGPQVDAREAYVDLLLLNVYGGPGQTAVNIDDLEISGVVPRNESMQPAAAVVPSNPSNPAQPMASPFPGAGVGPPAIAAASASGENSYSTPHQVAFNGSLLMVDGRPMFPRIIQSQGEPLVWLKQEGFNVVRTTGPITDQMLAEAQQAGIWLIGPPPQVNQQTPGAEPALAPITPAFAPVLAWHLGSGLAARELPSTAALAKQLRTADRQLRRPLVCNAEEESLAYSRQVDVLTDSRFPLGTSLELKDYGVWLAQRPRLARPGTPLWAVVQTEAAPSVVEQVATLAGKQSPEPTIEADSMRLLLYQAFCGGARGIEFASSSRLDAADNATRQRAAELALLNLELELLQPWGAAGDYVTTATTSNPNISAVVLNADKARLVVAMRIPQGSQYLPAPETSGTSLPSPSGIIAPDLRRKSSDLAAGNSALKDTSKLFQRSGGGNGMLDDNGDQTQLPSFVNPLFPEGVGPVHGTATTLVVPGVPEDYHVYELTPAGLRPLRHQQTTGGTAIALEDFLLTSVVLLTADPIVEQKLRSDTRQLVPRAAKLQRQLTAAMLEQAAAVNSRLSDQSQLPSAATPLATASAGLQKADQLLATADAAWVRDEILAADYYAQAYLAARNAAFPLEHWKREVWERITKLLPSPVSSPLAVDFNTLPEQLNFAASITGPPPGENLLMGGDFENLPGMLQAGWRHFEHTRPDLQTGVELSPVAPFAAQHSLHLQVQTVRPQSPTALAGILVESPPLWVTSAPVHLAAGDAVCIRGQVRVLQPIVGSVDGLMIIDSLGGQPLAQRIDHTDGWREFVMYRAAPYAEDLTLTFALTGIGQAWIDDVSIRPIRRGNVAGPVSPAGPTGPANLTSLGWPNPAFSPQRH
jgi:hypothetical protein